MHVPQVGYVHPVELRYHLAQLDQFFRVAPRVGEVGHPRREPDRPLLHPFPHEPLRRLQVGAPQRPVMEPYRPEPHRAVRDRVCHVDRALLMVAAQEGVHRRRVDVLRRQPIYTGQVLPVDQVILLGQGRVRQPVLPQHLGRDALAQPVRVLRVQQQRAVRVGMRVDEARRYRQPRRVDHPRHRAAPRGVGQVPDGHDLAAPDAHVAAKARTPRAIDHRPAAYQYVKHSISS